MRKFIGITTLTFVGAAVAAAVISVFIQDRIMGMMFLASVFILSPLVVYSYCSKCSCRKDCAHVLPGILAGILTEREQNPYKFADFAGLILPVAFIVVFPQFWIYNTPVLAAVFWGLFALAGIIIPFALCKNCKNMYCPLASSR